MTRQSIGGRSCGRRPSRTAALIPRNLERGDTGTVRLKRNGKWRQRWLCQAVSVMSSVWRTIRGEKVRQLSDLTPTAIWATACCTKFWTVHAPAALAHSLALCSPRLKSSDIMASRDYKDGIRPRFAPPRGARHLDLRRVRRRADRGPEADRLPLPGCRAFGGDLRGVDRRLVCRTRDLARADAHPKEAGGDNQGNCLCRRGSIRRRRDARQ